jgi:adhesin/invasin
MRRTTQRLLGLAVICSLAAACGGGGSSSRVANIPPGPPLPPAGVPLDMTSTVGVTPLTTITANGTAIVTITVNVRDINGSGLNAQTVSLNVTGDGNILTPQSGATNASGIFIATLASTKAEMKTISAVVNPGIGQILLTIQPTVAYDPVAIGSPDPNQSTLVANPLSGLNSNGSDASALTITVRDSSGVAIPNTPVALSSDAGTSFTATTGMTNGSGVFLSSMTSTQAGAKTIRLLIDSAGANVLSASRPVIVFNAPPGTPDPTQSNFAASPIQGITADGVDVSNLTITIRDPAGNTLAGETVNLAVTGTSTTLNPASGTTDAQGVFTSTLSTTAPGVKTVSAIINPGASQVTLDQKPTISFSPPLVPNKFQSTVEVTPMTGVFGNGKQTADITLTVRDLNNNPLPGRPVMLMSSGTNNTITAMSGNTDGSGVFTATISTTTPEMKILTGVIDPGGSPIEIDTKPDVTFDAVPPGPSAALSTATATPTMGILANGVATSMITVTVVDAANCPLNAQMVSMASNGTNDTFTPMTGMTDINGVFSCTLVTTDPGTKTVTVTMNPGASQVVLTAMPQITFVP